MRASLFLLAALAALFCRSSSAFAPQQQRTFQAARVVPGSTATSTAAACRVVKNKPKVVLHMSDTEKQQPPAAEAEKPEAPTSGTFYDDEAEPPKKEGISDAMKQRLMAEASTGLDSDKKQTNVLLYIMAAVALLVILGGQGIFY